MHQTITALLERAGPKKGFNSSADAQQAINIANQHGHNLRVKCKTCWIEAYFIIRELAK